MVYGGGHVDLVVAVGGGSVIDCAKAVAVGARLDRDVWDVFDLQAHAAFDDVVPIAVVLTIPASDSCVISNDELGLKSAISSDLIRPRAAFMDPELTMTLPVWRIFAGITDICAHIMERFFSRSEDVVSTDSIALALLRSVRSEALKLLRDPSDYDARANVMWLGTLAHSGLAGNGRNEDWGSHGLEHELSAVKPTVTHGAGLAVIFPVSGCATSATPTRAGSSRSGARSSGWLPPETTSPTHTRLSIRFRSSLSRRGMPRSLDAFGFTSADVDSFLVGLRENKGARFGSFKTLDMNDARVIYESAFEPHA